MMSSFGRLAQAATRKSVTATTMVRAYAAPLGFAGPARWGAGHHAGIDAGIVVGRRVGGDVGPASAAFRVADLGWRRWKSTSTPDKELLGGPYVGFDTYQIVRHLEAKGFSTEQSEAIMTTLKTIIEANAFKNEKEKLMVDIQKLSGEVGHLSRRCTRRAPSAVPDLSSLSLTPTCATVRLLLFLGCIVFFCRLRCSSATWSAKRRKPSGSA